VPARLADDPTATHWSWLVQVPAASDPFATTASGVRSMDHAVPDRCPPAHAGAPGIGHLYSEHPGNPKDNRRAMPEKRHIRSISPVSGRVA
jgi:hypothetical protein